MLSGSLPEPSKLMDEKLLLSLRSVASSYTPSLGKEYAAPAVEFLQHAAPLDLVSVVAHGGARYRPVS